MKCAAATLIVFIVLASQAFAVFRPLFPAKAAPPFGAEAGVLGNGSVQHPTNEVPVTAQR